jgi:UPF0755 protein
MILMKKVLPFLFAVVVIGIFVATYYFLAPVRGPANGRGKDKETEIFVVPEASEHFDMAGELFKLGYVRNEWITGMILNGKTITPGGYRLTKSMWGWEVIRIVMNKPSLLWVTINGCLRREQIGEMIGKKLGWDSLKLDQWNSAYKNYGEEYVEGVYYPDTYLIPTDETGDQVAKRFIDRFNEIFAPYSQKFQDANIRWVTALKIASLIEREAGGSSDMKLISGIIWNRLDLDMRLQIDATMQYTKGKQPSGSWWGNIDLSEKTSESPYNTYIHKGLPPTPICSPSITSIIAVLEPEETDCLFYLHDKDKQIHCAKTYAEHKENISQYLQ